MNQDENRFFEEIADDFFAECDELLAQVKRNLLKLEEQKKSQRAGKALMEDLLRSFHTLKGLTGMIGASNSIKLIHATETYLKKIYEGRYNLNQDALDTVFSSVTAIELQLEALRRKTEIPDVSDVLSRIEKLNSPENSANDTGAGEIASEPHERTSAIVMKWKFLFTPSRELYEKGININVVRERITSLGEVTESRPEVLEDGRISFEFDVLTDRPESDFSPWTTEGIRYVPIENAYNETIEKIPGSGTLAFQKNVVRVELGKLDEIMKTVGDLVISRARLNDHLTSIDSKMDKTTAIHEVNTQIDRQLRDLREGIMKLRLVPAGEAFERLRFAARDLIRDSGKSIRLETTGEDTQVDKFVMEKTFDSLLHIVRNAVSHGIENPGERTSSGKPAEGTITLRASASGDYVVFEVEDDGAGIDRQRIREKAIQNGIINPDNDADDEMLMQIMTSPGFSTKNHSDMVSGRGVGMNIARKTISELGGTFYFFSEPGKGTRFTIRLPLTLSIVNALIVQTGDSVFAVPLPAVNEVIKLNKEDLINMENNELLSNRDAIIPVLRLQEFFKLGISNRNSYHALVTGQGNERAAIVVDRIVGQREIVVRTLPDPMVRVDGISGATELGEGKIVLIIDVNTLIKAAVRMKQKAWHERL